MSLSDFLFTACQIEANQHKNSDNDHLDQHERRTIYLARKDEFYSVSSLVALNFGCWHCRIERFCATGISVNRFIRTDDSEYPPCVDKCPICTKTWKKIFKPVFWHGLVHFLDSEYASRAFPMPVIDYKCDALSNLVWKNEDAIALIYDRKRGTVQKSNVDALMMQLITLRILEFQDINNTGCGFIVLAREKTPFSPFNKYRYKNINSYYGMEMIRLADGKQRKNKYQDLLSKDSLK
jgi:hypothetical protein